ncbi:hypothetical protein OKW27_001505 [Paraburkholderia sp. 35.1]
MRIQLPLRSYTRVGRVHFISCYVYCPAASTASATMACSPIPCGGTISRRYAGCCMSRPPARRPPLPMHHLAISRRASSAGTAARRWSSSTSCSAAHRSAHRPHSEPQHECECFETSRPTVGSPATGPDSGRLRPSPGSRGFALRAPPETPAGPLRQRASSRHQPGSPDLTVIPTSRATAPIPIAIQVPAAPGHSAVSSIGVCTTPARMLLWRAPMCTVKGRHTTNLNKRCRSSRESPTAEVGCRCRRPRGYN